MVKEDVLHISDVVMQTLLSMLNTASGQVGGVQEDAILTIGALVECKILLLLIYLLLTSLNMRAIVRYLVLLCVCVSVALKFKLL